MYFTYFVFPRPDCFQKILQLMTMCNAHEWTYLNSPPPLWSTIWNKTKFLIIPILRIIWNLFPVGCIFAELLNMLSENVKTFEKRRPLFPGERYAKSSTHSAFLLYYIYDCFVHVLYNFMYPIDVFYLVALFHFYSTAWCFSWKNVHDCSSHTISFIFSIFHMSLHCHVTTIFFFFF